MNSIKQVCDTYGFTLEELARYLKVSPSLCRMAAGNRRMLPTHALLALAPLATFQPPATAGMNGSTVAIEEEKAELRFQKMRLERMLKKLQLPYSRATNRLALAGHLVQKILPNEQEAKRVLRIQQDAENIIRKISREQILLLQWKIKWLEKMVADDEPGLG